MSNKYSDKSIRENLIKGEYQFVIRNLVIDYRLLPGYDDFDRNRQPIIDKSYYPNGTESLEKDFLIQNNEILNDYIEVVKNKVENKLGTMTEAEIVKIIKEYMNSSVFSNKYNL